MWNVPPSLMCQQHLLGEHVELHMFVGSMARGISMGGYLEKGLLEIENLAARHAELVEEMVSRGLPSGLDHQTPLIQPEGAGGRVDWQNSLIELHRRCPDCRELIREWIFEEESA